jgi:hypothetical protein
MVSKSAIKTNSRVHTFGVGSNASVDLVKQIALAGFGSFSIVD